MAGFVPAIHVLSRENQDVDARDKPGHDEFVERATICGHVEPARSLHPSRRANGALLGMRERAEFVIGT